jgi:hypothetical protein
LPKSLLPGAVSRSNRVKVTLTWSMPVSGASWPWVNWKVAIGFCWPGRVSNWP